MHIQEKLYSIFAILFVIAFFLVLSFFPVTRQLKVLLPLAFVGVMINIIFIFIVLRDIFLRQFKTTGQKLFWIVLVLLFWPAVLVYLPKFGFKPRTPAS
jgi:hypothetical protein